MIKSIIKYKMTPYIKYIIYSKNRLVLHLINSAHTYIPERFAFYMMQYHIIHRIVLVDSTGYNAYQLRKKLCGPVTTVY